MASVKLGLLIVGLLLAAGWLLQSEMTQWQRISPYWGAILLLVTFFNYLMEPLRWCVYVQPVYLRKVGSIFQVFFSVAFLTYVLPAKLGVPLRFWLVQRNLGLPATDTAVYLALDGALNVLVWTIACFLLGAGTMYKFYTIDLLHAKYWLAFIGLIAAVIFWAMLRWERPIRQRLVAALKHISITRLTLAILLFCMEIALFVFLHGSILRAIDLPFIGWLSLATITVLSLYAGFLSMLPMGLVGYDVSIIFLLMQYGVGLEQAALVPVVYRLSIITMSILLGLPAIVRSGISFNLKELVKRIQAIRKDRQFFRNSQM